MHAIVVDDGHIARLPVVTHAVMDLVARAVENVEGGLIHMAMLL